MELSDFLTTLLASTGVSVFFSGILIFLVRTWISERIQQSIRHEYDQKLALLNAELHAESEKNVILLKSSIESEAEKLRFATSSVSNTQRSSIERRLTALETLWDGVLAARQNVPVVMGFIDILSPEEYTSMKDHPDFQVMVGELSMEKMLAMYKDNIGSRERVRPYVGEYTWALVATYQAIVMRMAFLIQSGERDTSKLNWHADSGINQLLSSAFTQKELEEFKATSLGKFGWIQRKFEAKILAAMRIVISGEQFGEEALRQAQLMEEKVQQLKAKQQSGS